MGKFEELEKLTNLKSSGVITEMEFEIEKQKILNESEVSNNRNVANNGNSPLSTASLVCGIVSFLIIPFIFGIVAVILGIIGLAKQENKKAFSIIGIILGIIGVLWAIYSSGVLV